MPIATTLIIIIMMTTPLLISAYGNNNPSSSASSALANRVKSVNYFISRECNYKCKFCFHTQTNTNKLPTGKSKLGLQLLQHSGTEKINFAGGEPFLNPQILGELCQFASMECNMAVSIISNGSLIKSDWMEQYGEYVDILGVSVDSFDPETNALIGRGTGDTTKNQHVSRVLQVRDMCS